MSEGAEVEVFRIAFGAMSAFTVGAAVRLGVFDELPDAGSDTDRLAAKLELPAAQTLRLLRALAALGLATEPEPDRFVPTATGRALRNDHPSGLGRFVRMFTDPVMLGAWPRLAESIRTGETMFDQVFGKPFFDQLATRPELSALFNDSMRTSTVRSGPLLAAAMELRDSEVIADIGGGDGTLLAAVLTAHPGTRGIVFDSVEGSAQAAARLEAAGLTDRCRVETGDFFTAVPEADVYLLKSIVHDWDDERAAIILRNCRDRLPEHGRVLVIELLLAPTVQPGTPARPYLVDLNMLVNLGGKERTRAEYETLFAAAGLRVGDVIALPPETGISIVVGVPA